MDPASAIGVASAVISFVEFSAKLISGAVEVYNSLDGSTRSDTHTKQISDDFDQLSQNLLNELAKQRLPLSTDEQELRSIAEQSRKTCNKLCEILKGLTTGHKSTWASIKTAWKSRRMEDDVQVLHSQLRDYRSQIVLRLSMMNMDSNARLKTELVSLLKTLQKSIRTDAQIEANIRGRIMGQLSFDSMLSRMETISKPEEGTLSWITDTSEVYEDQASRDIPEEFVQQQKKARKEARDQYMSWLKGASSSSPAPMPTPASQILFVAGKAGSGKSTLMRHLFKHAQSHPQMLAWANNREIIFVSFYFWVASNDKLQMTAQGLHRSVLYSVVDQHPDLCPVLFPDQWQAIRDRILQEVDDPSGKLDAARFDGNVLRAAFERIFDKGSSLAHRFCLCLFLDGLDEYRAIANYGKKNFKRAQESSREIVRDVLYASNAEHVRICCSARPHAEFELLRSKATMLRLEKANLCDIYRYCKQTIEKNDDFGQFGSRGRSLAHTLTSRCEGVFLWALLTVQLLLSELECHASDAELEAKLTAIPDGIDDLYAELLGQIDSTDRKQSDQALLLALKINNVPKLGRLPAFWILWIDEVLDTNGPLGNNPEIDRKTQFKTYERIARLKINRLTRGILEISSSNQESGPLVWFFHRTAYDYIRERHSMGLLKSEKLENQNNSVFGRLFVANYVYLNRSVHSAFRGIKNCGLDKDTHRRTLTFLADNMALSVCQRSLLAGTDDHYYAPTALRFTPFSRSPYLNAESKDSTPILAGTTTMGYMFTRESDLLYQYHDDFDDMLPFLNSSDLFGVILGCSFYSMFKTAMNELRILLNKNASFCSFLRDKSKSGLPYPPWIFLAVCIINAKIDSIYRNYGSHEFESFDTVLRKIAPSESPPKPVITLSKFGERRLPNLRTIFDVKYPYGDEETGNKDTNFQQNPGEKSIHSHVRSIEYQGYRVDCDSALIIMCPGLN